MLESNFIILSLEMLSWRKAPIPTLNTASDPVGPDAKKENKKEKKNPKNNAQSKRT